MIELFTDTVLNMMTTTTEPEGYTDKNGLLYCDKCHTPKETYSPGERAAPFGRDRHPTEHNCQKTKRLEREAAEQCRKHPDIVESLKRQGFINPTMQGWILANSDGKRPQMEIAHFYVEH